MGMVVEVPQVLVDMKNLKWFFNIPEEDYTLAEKIYDNTKDDPLGKGQAGERYLSWLLSLFDVKVIEVVPGSFLDRYGVDILLQTSKGSLMVQVKRSPCGVLEYIRKKSKVIGPDFIKEILILWVNSSNPISRRNLFLLLTPVLESKDIKLKKEVRDVLKMMDLYTQKGLKIIPRTRREWVLPTNTLQLLERLGMIELRGGDYVLLK